MATPCEHQSQALSPYSVSQQPPISPYPVSQPPPLPPYSCEYQVFVSFRGKELRNGFVSHVVKALRVAGVNVFIDSYEKKGRDLQDLFTRIENSMMALVIFSDRFSESEWCLNELVKIDERVKERKIIAIPVFYRVNTDDVKYLKGKFGKSFIQTLQRQSTKEELMTVRWTNSVKSISGKTGFTSEIHRIDSDLVDAIVGEIKRALPHMPTKEKGLPIQVELFAAFVFVNLCIIIWPFVFSDADFCQTRQSLYKIFHCVILLWVLVRRKLFN